MFFQCFLPWSSHPSMFLVSYIKAGVTLRPDTRIYEIFSLFICVIDYCHIGTAERPQRSSYLHVLQLFRLEVCRKKDDHIRRGGAIKGNAFFIWRKVSRSYSPELRITAHKLR